MSRSSSTVPIVAPSATLITTIRSCTCESRLRRLVTLASSGAESGGDLGAGVHPRRTVDGAMRFTEGAQEGFSPGRSPRSPMDAGDRFPCTEGGIGVWQLITARVPLGGWTVCTPT
jgi:hypothetical protein